MEQHVGAWRKRGPAATFHGSAVITVALIVDTFLHAHAALALSFLRQQHTGHVPAVPTDGQFNTRRLVGPLMEQFRRAP